jgi:putative transposase
LEIVSMAARAATTEPAKKRTPSFVCEIPLRVTPAQQRTLLARFEAARQVYNACLGEARRRVRLIQQAKVYQQARKLPKDDPQRAALFAQARTQYHFHAYALHAYAGTLRQSWLQQHLDANTVQKLATRAYHAANRLLLGQAKRVRFKGPSQMDSVEGKKATVGIRWGTDRVEWSGLVLPALIDPADLVQAHGLASRVKYVRLVRRKFGDKQRFSAQLICEGFPYRKERHRLGEGVVGLDLGPQTIAMVSEQQTSLQMFCPDVVPNAQALRRLDRKIDRQRRANNPINYDEKGRVKPGKKHWHSSKRRRRTHTLRREYYRKLAATRKRCHGRLSHQVLALGNVLHVERLSYRAWQRRYGKSVGLCAPSMFMNRLSHLAESAGGRIVHVNARRAKLSQTCHCGAVAPKRLSERWHRCACGVSAQRDLYSAFLACFVDPDTSLLNAGRAQRAWPGREPVLQAAFEQATSNQPASRRTLPSSFGVPPRQSQSRSPAPGSPAKAKSQDAVPVRRRTGRAWKRRR